MTYIHVAPVPSIAANAVQVAKMCAAFQESGVEMTLVTPPAARGVRRGYDGLSDAYHLIRRFRVKRLPMFPLPGRQLLFGAGAVLLGGLARPDVLYTRSISVATVGMLMRLPTILELHSPAFSNSPSSRRRLSWLLRSKFLVSLVVITGRLRDQYKRDYPQSIGKILVAPDGADPLDYDRGEEHPSLVGDFRVGYVGHLYPGKGLEIIAKLADLCPWATFHIVGGNQDDQQAWKAKLAPTQNVVFHGYVRHSDVGGYLANIDVMLAPYLRTVQGVGGVGANLADWMSPLKVFEYMAAGKAIVATDLPVLREVLRDGENTILCSPDEIEQWAAALERLRSDPSFRMRIGSKARAEFLASYTWSKRASTILATLDRQPAVD